MFSHYLSGDDKNDKKNDKRVDFHTPKTSSTTAPITVPTSPEVPKKEAETSVGDGTYFSFELHKSEVFSKCSQVQIFLRYGEGGQKSSERERESERKGDRRRSEEGRGRDRGTQDKVLPKRERKRAKLERAQQNV